MQCCVEAAAVAEGGDGLRAHVEVNRDSRQRGVSRVRAAHGSLDGSGGSDEDVLLGGGSDVD